MARRVVLTDEMLRHPTFLIPTFEGLHQADHVTSEHSFFSFDILIFWLGHIMAAFTSFAAQALGSSCHRVPTDGGGSPTKEAPTIGRVNTPDSPWISWIEQRHNL